MAFNLVEQIKVNDTSIDGYQGTYYDDNPEFIKVITDQNLKILEGTRFDGSKLINGDLQIEGNIINDNINNIKKEIETTKTVIQCFDNIDNPEYLQITTDNNGKILEGIRTDGTKIYGSIPQQISQFVEEKIEELKEDIGFVIENPYVNITNKVRHRAISHEHICGTHAQQMLEAAINDGIDVLCASNYTPGVPIYPIDNIENDYEEWEFLKDNEGNIIYEKYSDGSIREQMEITGDVHKVPTLKRVIKTFRGYQNYFRDFYKKDGSLCEIANLVQLPNAEQGAFSMANRIQTGGFHLCFVGSLWANAVNGNTEDEDLLADLNKYNTENGYNLTLPNLHNIFPQWDVHQMLQRIQQNLLFRDKVFGTLNHPGWTGMYDYQVDYVMSLAPNAIKAMEIFNYSDPDWVVNEDRNIIFYDKTLMRGYKLWCTAVNDWGRGTGYPDTYPDRCGCNLLYLPSNYDSLSNRDKQRLALNAMIDGSFSACGFGGLDLTDVNVSEKDIYITFNQIPERTVIDIDGVRTEMGATKTLHVEASRNNTFIRFEAYKGIDFIFTQPFFITKK